MKNEPQIKQSDDSKKFFDTYGFTMTISRKHPERDGMMNFEGLEAEYVSNLEQQIKSMKTFIDLQNQKINFLMDKEFYKWKHNEK